jgi:hypothetical protein
MIAFDVSGLDNYVPRRSEILGQAGFCRRLQYVIERVFLKRAHRVSVISRDERDLRPMTHARQDLNARDFRKLYIEKCRIRSQCVDHLDRGEAVFVRAADFDVGIICQILSQTVTSVVLVFKRVI